MLKITKTGRKIKMKTEFDILCDLSNLENRWEELFSNKHMLASGEEKLDYDNFTDLVDETYNVLKENVENYKDSPSQFVEANPLFIFGYAELVSAISRYSGTENMMEFNEDYFVSLLIAQKLSEVMCPSYMNENFDNKLSFIPKIDDYIDLETDNPEIDEKEYIYNIGSHDFSDFIELAEVISYMNN